jgi:hypothetical protein
MTTPNRQVLCEFPDPVVAAYLKQVLDLPEAPFAALNHLPRPRLVSLTHPTTWWLAPVALWQWAGSMWRRRMMRQIGTAGCRDVDAAHEYQLFYEYLSHGGWRPVGEGRVALALYVLRWRNILPDAPQKYAKHMGSFVPATVLGWSVHEPSA